MCGPSRKCLFSGLYPQTINDYGFAAWKDTQGLQGCVPLPLHFRNNGYNTYGTGKLLHEGAGGEFYTAYGIGPDYGPWPWQGKGGPMNTPHPAQFGTWKAHLPLAMHRDLNYGPLSNVPDWKADAVKGIPGAKGWYNESGKRFRYINAKDRDRMPDEISLTGRSTSSARSMTVPSTWAVGFIRPHTPLYAPGNTSRCTRWRTSPFHHTSRMTLPTAPQFSANAGSGDYKKYQALVAAGGEKAWKEWVQAYMACMSFVDDQIGKVLAALEASPYREHSDRTHGRQRISRG